MKKINIARMLLFALALGASSCQDDGYVEPEFKTKSFGLYASFFYHGEGGANINPTLLSTNKVEGIKDISLGYTAHEWSFWSGNPTLDPETGEREWTQTQMSEGINFIKENQNLGWGTLEDYTPYVDPSIAPTNSLKDLTFFFDKGGIYKLKIRNEYDTRIRYMYSVVDPVSNGNSNQYIDAEPCGDGKYEVVREYEFQVFAPLTPSAKVYSDAALTQPIDLNQQITIDEKVCWEIRLNAGTSLYFKDTTGEDEAGVSSFYTAPTARAWTWTCEQAPSNHVGPIPTVNPLSSTAQTQQFTFDEAGMYMVNLRVERTAPAGYSTKFPEANVTQTLPFVVYVN